MTRQPLAGDIPSRIARLPDLACNLWWTWQPEAQDLFSFIDAGRWEASNRNPVALLRSATGADLQRLAADDAFLGRYDRVVQAFDAYIGAGDTWFAQTFPGDHGLIAYFCAEYGLHQSLPIYSGGLGVLAGDHCKTASDLGLPFVAVGLWYTQGYFRQRIAADGRQVAKPDPLPLADAPLLPAYPDGRDLVVQVEMAGRTLRARVWRLLVGRVTLYLLDANVAENGEADRALCGGLYGGDREIRLAQEMLLGIGGVRALRALGLAPVRWHMNEGHVAFMGLERIRELVERGVPFVDAWPAEAEATVFTTHTPVPAGNEVFKDDLVKRYFAAFHEGMALDMEGFLKLANEEQAPPGSFAMTPLALRLSHRANGVSALHGAVARSMWSKQFPGLNVDQVPITSVTNGVHSPTWIAPRLRALFDRYFGPRWLESVDDPALWERLAEIPDRELWEVHQILKAELFTAARSRAVGDSGERLRPDVLTIGFARRFATYKRATLFFHDLERAAAIVGDAQRPVQLVFAGKAHPADSGGQALIASVVALSSAPPFAGRVAFLEGYDMGLAAALVQGVDLWLNNPERPQEASGTSGQKASLNLVPNCSIPDGWWDEAYNGRNGWSFGAPVGDIAIDCSELYEVLERSVIPTYYRRGADGIPTDWVAIMREAVRTVAPAFSAQRMVKEYTTRLYR